VKRLPRSLDELRGLRFARWIRESTAGQYDQFGPDSQRRKQDDSAERYGLVDVGLTYEVAVSGKIAWRSPTMRRMLDEARAGAFDVLLVGYSDRWQRNLRQTLNLLEEDLHPAGVVVLFADRKILSSDPDDWDELVSEATSAERYIRRLAGRITDGYAAKFRRYADQAGNPTLGFRRSSEPPHLLEVDPITIERAVDIFHRYARGNVSTADVALEVDLGEEQVRKMLRNRLYNGWAVRHRGVEQLPAPWRAAPPVSDDLWATVQDVRQANTRGGGPRRVDRADPLLGLLWCVCGRRIRADGMMGSGASQRRARMHPEPCDEWGAQARYAAETWEEPIADQVASLRLDDRTIDQIRRAVTAPEPVAMAGSPARFRRLMRDLAEEHVAERLTDEAYLAGLAELRRQEADVQVTTTPAASFEVALGYLEDLKLLWTKATPAEQAELVRGIYARVEVAGPRFVGATLTPEAYANGLAIALPESGRRLVERPRQDSNLRPSA
jgi:DNA invertase Pin-like site-specific DNA recombinase